MKKLLSILLTVIMVLSVASVMSLTAFAEGSPDFGLYLADNGQLYKASFTGNGYETVSKGDALNLDDFEGMTWDEDHWVMKDFTFETTCHKAIYMDAACEELEIHGANTITGGDAPLIEDTPSDVVAYAIGAGGDLTLTGDGTLTLTSGETEYTTGVGIYVVNAMNVEKGVSLNVSTSVSMAEIAIKVLNSAETEIALKISGKVYALTEDLNLNANAEENYAICVNGDILIDEDGQVYAESGVAGIGDSVAIWATGSVTVAGSVIAMAGKSDDEASYGIMAESVNVSGSLYAGGAESGTAYGIQTEALHVTGQGVLTACGVTKALESADNITAPYGTPAVAGADVYGNGATADNIDIAEDGTVTLSNNPIYVQIGIGYGLYLGDDGAIYQAANSELGAIAGKELDAEDFKESLYWDEENDRWVMDDFSFITAYPVGVVFDAACTEVALIGENTVKSGNLAADCCFGVTIYAEDFTFSGNGILNAMGDVGYVSSGVSAEGKLTIEKGVTVNATGPAVSLIMNFGLMAGDDVTVAGKLNATAGISFLSASAGIMLADVDGNPKTLTVTGECKASCESYAVLANVEMQGEGALLLQGGKAVIPFEYNCNLTIPTDIDDLTTLASPNMSGTDASEEGIEVAEDGKVTFKAPYDSGNSILPKYILIGDFKAEEPSCTYKTALANAEDATLVLGGKEAGNFDVVKTCNGIQLKQEEQYLAFASNNVVLQDAEYTWKFDGGLYAEVTTTKTTKFLFWSFKKNVVTKYYLTFVGEDFALTTDKVCAQMLVTEDDHAIAYKHDGDGMHVAYCTRCDYEEAAEEHEYNAETHLCICGKFDPDECYVTGGHVCVSTAKVQNGGFWFWKKYKTVYHYDICMEAQNTGIACILYSGNGESWNEGFSFNSDVALTTFYIRVTDTCGKVTDWVWDGEEVTQITDEPEDAFEDQSYLWWTGVEAGSAAAVQKITFTKSGAIPSGYEKTWDAPANSTAYFDEDTGELTFMLDAGVNSFVFNDANLFRTCPRTLSDAQYGDLLTQCGGIFTTVDELKAFGLDLNAISKAIFAGDEDEILSLTNATVGLMNNYQFETYDELMAIFSLETIRGIIDEYFIELFSLYGLSAAGGGEQLVTVSGLELFDTSAVTDFTRMFSNFMCASLDDVLDFNVSNGKHFTSMFEVSYGLGDCDFSNWDTSKAVDMYHMFARSTISEFIPGTGFSTANVTTMNAMFRETFLTQIDISMLDTSNVTDMSYMFFESVDLEQVNIGSINTSKVTSMRSMFSTCDSLNEVIFGDIDTSNVTNMGSMFSDCAFTELDISALDTGKVTTMLQMFAGCRDLAHIYVGENWVTTLVTSSSDMFKDCDALTGGNVTETDKTYAYAGGEGYLELKED